MPRMVSALLIVASLAMLSSANAGAAPDEGPVSVKILGSGEVLDEGTAAEVRVRVECDPSPPLLEALVTGSQEGNVGFGQGFFVGLACDGQARTVTARIQTFDPELFRRGKARVSAFILLCDPVSGECFDGQDTRLVQLH